VEQLNWMGLYEDDFSSEQWELLLVAEPGDLIMSDSSGTLELQYARAHYGNAYFHLACFSHLNN
jgi:hypothetical protein